MPTSYSPPPVPRAHMLRGSRQGYDQKKTFYVIGGVGPAAQIPFQNALLSCRQEAGANSDQSHAGYMLGVETAFPDRTEALQKKKQGDMSDYDDIKYRIFQAATFAHREGFDFFVATCNTLHAWREDEELIDALPIKWVSMIKATAEELRKSPQSVERVGILATTGTLMTGLYQSALEASGFVSFPPQTASLSLNDLPNQSSVMAAIYDPLFGIKACGAEDPVIARHVLEKAVSWLEKHHQVQAVIAGCTEISLVLNQSQYHGVTMIDPVKALAQKCIALASSEGPVQD